MLDGLDARRDIPRVWISEETLLGESERLRPSGMRLWGQAAAGLVFFPPEQIAK